MDEAEKVARYQRAEREQQGYTSMKIPPLFRDKTLKTFKGFEKEVAEAKKALEVGMNIFLSGSCGTGKTHLAVALLWHLWEKQNGGYVPLFLPAVEFFLELKKSFAGEGEMSVLDKYSDTVLVIDDVGAEKISDWSRQVFYTLIDRRYRNIKQTIITSNLSLDEFAEKFDDRIISRLCENGVAITLKGEDQRITKGAS